MTWKDWIRLHGDTFALTGPQFSAVLTAWSHVLNDQGVTPAQAADASRWLAANDPPEFPSAHLKALQARLRAASAAQTARGSSDAPDASGCVLCGGTGYVQVARPADYEAGRYGTAVVLCRCPLGIFIHRDQRDRFPQMKPPKPVFCTLAEYDSMIEWCDVLTGEVRYGPEARTGMLASMKARQRHDLDAADLARRADRAMGRPPTVFAAALRKNNIRQEG